MYSTSVLDNQIIGIKENISKMTEDGSVIVLNTFYH